jgi:hypothetical protein
MKNHAPTNLAMSGARSRSVSVSRVRNEGINPFERLPSSAQHEQMIEAGREAMLRQLEQLAGCDVRFVQTVMRGREPMDQFSFRSADTAERDQIALFAKLQALAGTARVGEGVVLVYVSQAHYDRRAVGLDVTICQCALIGALTGVAILLVLFALQHLLADHWALALALLQE